MSELLRISVPCLLTGSEGQNASLQKATCLIDPQNTILLPFFPFTQQKRAFNEVH